MKMSEKSILSFTDNIAKRNFNAGFFSLTIMLVALVSFFMAIQLKSVLIAALFVLAITYEWSRHHRILFYCHHVVIKSLFGKKHIHYQEIIGCKVELNSSSDGVAYDAYLRFYNKKYPVVISCGHNYKLEDLIDLLYHKEAPVVFSGKIGMIEMNDHDFRIITIYRRNQKELKRQERIRKCWEK